MRSSSLPIDKERALRADAARIFMGGCTLLKLRRPTLLRVRRRRRQPAQPSAVRHCAAKPTPRPHLTAPAAATCRACAVPRGAGPEDMFLTPQAAQEAASARPRHDEHRVGGHSCANNQHRQLGGREGRAESEGARVHADVVRKDPLGHVHARLPPCLPRAAWPSNPACHEKWHATADAGSLEWRARRRYRKVQDASSWRTRRIQTESGAARACPRAAVAIWSYR